MPVLGALLPLRICFVFVSSSGAVSVVLLCFLLLVVLSALEEPLLEIVLGRLPSISQSVPSCPQMGCVGTLGLT